MKNDPFSAIPPNFWDDSDYYTGPTPLSLAMISQAEKILGYKLPDSYIQLLISQNGGTPRNTCFPTSTPTSWADDHIAISGICGLGGQWGIDSPELGSAFMLAEWGYPPIGIVVAQCPSAGHDAVMLDYRRCGAQGEPQVVHVSVEDEEEPHITLLADSFVKFLAGLESEEHFTAAAAEQSFADDLDKVDYGRFSDLLLKLCQGVQDFPDMEAVIRRISRALTQEKGHFTLHDDSLSQLLYDVQFWLYTQKHPVKRPSTYFDVYPDIIVFGEEFGTGGYAPDSIKDWYNSRLSQGLLAKTPAGLQFTPAYTATLLQELSRYQ